MLPTIMALLVMILYVARASVSQMELAKDSHFKSWRLRYDDQPGDITPLSFVETEQGKIEDSKNKVVCTGLICDAWKHEAKSGSEFFVNSWNHLSKWDDEASWATKHFSIPESSTSSSSSSSSLNSSDLSSYALSSSSVVHKSINVSKGLPRCDNDEQGSSRGTGSNASSGYESNNQFICYNQRNGKIYMNHLPYYTPVVDPNNSARNQGLNSCDAPIVQQALNSMNSFLDRIANSTLSPEDNDILREGNRIFTTLHTGSPFKKTVPFYYDDFIDTVTYKGQSRNIEIAASNSRDLLEKIGLPSLGKSVALGEENTANHIPTILFLYDPTTDGYSVDKEMTLIHELRHAVDASLGKVSDCNRRRLEMDAYQTEPSIGKQLMIEAFRLGRHDIAMDLCEDIIKAAANWTAYSKSKNECAIDAFESDYSKCFNHTTIMNDFHLKIFKVYLRSRGLNPK